jgi:hypothetical protein
VEAVVHEPLRDVDVVDPLRRLELVVEDDLVVARGVVLQVVEGGELLPEVVRVQDGGLGDLGDRAPYERMYVSARTRTP